MGWEGVTLKSKTCSLDGISSQAPKVGWMRSLWQSGNVGHFRRDTAVA